MPDEPTPIVQILKNLIQRGERWAENANMAPGNLAMWNAGIKAQLTKIYGGDASVLLDFPTTIDRTIASPREELSRRIEYVRRLVEILGELPNSAKTPLLGKKVFIGHGRSLVWLQLKDYIREQFRLPCDEFNVEPSAGVSTTERLETMLVHAGFAFVVMTAEDSHADGLTYARPNVIHEAGLFQGRLGNRRAIVLLEEGCSDFSNISGLTQIRFPKGDMRASYDEVRRVLKRERLI